MHVAVLPWYYIVLKGRDEQVELGQREMNTHPQKLPPNQQTPSVHPTAVSPLKLLQLSTKSGVNGLPAVRAVNSKRDVTQR